MTLYFTYGSSISLKHMKGSCGDRGRKLGVGYMEGYRLVFDGKSKKWGGAVTDLVEDKNDRVRGVLFEIDGFLYLDRYEAYPYVYDRREVWVVLSDTGERLKVTSYIKNNSEEKGKPSQTYIKLIKVAKENKHPEDWIGYLKSFR